MAYIVWVSPPILTNIWSTGNWGWYYNKLLYGAVKESSKLVAMFYPSIYLILNSHYTFVLKEKYNALILFWALIGNNRLIDYYTVFSFLFS